MAMVRTGYELRFEEIARECPDFGEAALVPWDSESFGFPVGVYRTPAAQIDPAARQSLQTHFLVWMEDRGALLCSCTVPAARSFWRVCLPGIGFHFVDYTLQVTLGGLPKARLPGARLELRRAEPEDRSAIEAIAAHSFTHGRYHADPLFPDHLADLRYVHWVRRALSGTNAADRVFVLGGHGEVLGFCHVTVEGDVSDLRLAAVAPDLKATMVGVDLYAATLRALQNLGIRRVVSTISCANAGVMSIYAMLGFRFSNPEIVYHWHASGFAERTAQ